MWMTLEERHARFPDRPAPIPLEYAGKWIAITQDRTEIVAAAEDPLDICRTIDDSGRDDLTMLFVRSTAQLLNEDSGGDEV